MTDNLNTVTEEDVQLLEKYVHLVRELEDRGEDMPTEEDIDAIESYVANLRWLEENGHGDDTEEDMLQVAQHVANLQFSEDIAECVLCGESIGIKDSNNPWPLASVEDRCCHRCNCSKVLPARLEKPSTEPKTINVKVTEADKTPITVRVGHVK